MNWKLLLLPLAVLVEVPAALINGRETGFGNWVIDRKLGDPVGKPCQTRKQALEEQSVEAGAWRGR